MNKLVGVLSGALPVTGGVAIYLGMQLRAERARTGESVALVQTPESALQAHDPAARSTADTTVVAGQAAATAAQEQSPGRDVNPANGSTAPGNHALAADAGKGTQPGKHAANPTAAAYLEMVSSPEGQQMVKSMMRGILPTQYPDLGRELGLTPAETEQFFELLARQQDELSMDSIAMMNGSDPATMQAAQRNLAEKQQAHEGQIAAALGDRYEKWQDYKSTAPVRREVNELRGTLSNSSYPLTDSQSRQLIPALAAEQKRLEQEERDWMIGAGARSPNMMQESIQRTIAGRQRLVQVAATYLTPDQLEQYRRQTEQQMQFVQSMMDATGMTGARPQPKP